MLLVSLFIGLSAASALGRQLPTRVLAGVTVPDTPVVKAAYAYAEQHSVPVVWNHVVRSWLYGSLIASRTPEFKNVDLEVHAVSALLHDLGFDFNTSLVSPDKRFEVDGAIAAREFLVSEAPGWDRHRQQLVWDSIALHTTLSIALYKEAEVRLAGIGISTDFSGPNNVTVKWDEWNRIVTEFPRTDLRKGVTEAFLYLCQTKKATTADNVVGEFGEKYLPGFNLTGFRLIDIVQKGIP